MADKNDEQVKNPEVTKNAQVDKTPAVPSLDVQTNEPEDKPKTVKRTRSKKQVNLDEDMEKVHPTFATGIQAVMRDLIKNKGKK